MEQPHHSPSLHLPSKACLQLPQRRPSRGQVRQLPEDFGNQEGYPRRGHQFRMGQYDC